MRLLQITLSIVRAAIGALAWGAGVTLGPLLFRQKRSGRPVIAFQAYAEHLLYFHEYLIKRLLADNCVDVVVLTWPHPQFPWRTQARLRALATSVFGLDQAQVVPFWRACWWRFDFMIANDALTLPVLRRTRMCHMFHGPIISNRYFRRAPFRRPVYETDLAFPSGSYCRGQILAACGDRPRVVRIYTTGSPNFDKYFHPDRPKVEYLRALGLDESRPVVVYAPHWSQLDRRRRAGMDLISGALGELAKLPVQVIVKLHAMSMIPGVSGALDRGDLLRAVDSSRVRIAREVEDVQAILAADLLVTDVSSRAFNAMLLDKPVVLYSHLHPAPGAFAQLGHDMYLRGATVAHTPHELRALVQEALASPHVQSEQRRRVAEELFANPGRATAEVTRVLYTELRLVDGKEPLRRDAHRPIEAITGADARGGLFSSVPSGRDQMGIPDETG